MQTKYDLNPEIATAGMRIDLPNELNDIISRLSEESNFPFGRLSVLGTDKDRQALLPALATDITNAKKVLGVTVLDINREFNQTKKDNGLEQGYDVKNMMAVLKRGRIWVQAEDAVNPESAVYVRFAEQPQVSDLVFDADLITGNSVDLKIDGAAITTVPFNADHVTTMGDLATEIAGNAKVTSAVVGGAGNRTITITTIDGDNSVILTDIVVSGGASQANGSWSVTTVAKPSADKGKFRSDADIGTSAALLAGARYMSSAIADGFVQLSLNQD